MVSRGRILWPLALLLAAAPGAAADDPFSGTYAVKGMTTDVRSGDTRRIDGHIVLTLKGEVYRAASELTTDFPTPGGAVHADVIGTGEGKREGDMLKGTAHTQVVMQTAPGVDPNFAFIPRQVGPRIRSSWTARLEKDGTIVVELSNKPEKGEQYRETTTKLRGTRVAMPGEAKPAAPR
jgi:hypothetical protein